MRLSEAKKLFKAGFITNAAVLSPIFKSDNNCWTICFSLAENNKAVEPVLETAKGEDRQFKTLDAACTTLKEIGLTSFSVSLR